MSCRNENDFTDIRSPGLTDQSTPPNTPIMAIPDNITGTCIIGNYCAVLSNPMNPICTLSLDWISGSVRVYFLYNRNEGWLTFSGSDTDFSEIQRLDTDGKKTVFKYMAFLMERIMVPCGSVPDAADYSIWSGPYEAVHKLKQIAERL